MSANRCRFFVLFFLTILSATFPAQAIEWFPEYQTLTETEESMLESPEALNSEYQSDVLAYRKPDWWQYDWLAHPRAFDLSVGSVSAAHFNVDTRFKVHKRLSDPLEFRLSFFQERNRERDSNHLVLELVVWPWKWLGLAFYGEPELYKRNDDTGLALLIKPAPTHEIRLFQTFVDVTRLKRNDRNDTYVEPHLPYSRGLVGRYWGEPGSESKGEFVEYALRQETFTQWRFPDEKYDYRYWKGFASVFGGVRLTERIMFYGRAQWDRKFESKTPLDATSTITASSLRTDRVFVTARARMVGLEGVGLPADWELVPGLEFAYRRWQGSPGQTGERDLLPNLWLRVPAFGTGETRDVFEVGVDTQWHRETGDRTAFLAERADGAVNSRLNLVYEFRFRDDAFLRLLTSADLDRFGSAQSWEGGCGQLRMTF